MSFQAKPIQGSQQLRGSKLRLDLIESNPNGSSIDGLVADINILCYEVYTQAIGATELRITNPVNESVRDYYLSKKGFSYNQRENFCFREI